MESFKNIVYSFWNTFSYKEAYFQKLIDDLNFLEFRKAINDALNIESDDITFEIGKKENGKYELIMTANGNKISNFMVNYCVKNAPQELKGKWNFYSTRPRMKEINKIKMFEMDFDIEDFIIYPKIYVQYQKIDIEIFSKKILNLSDDEKYNIIFVLLDKVIGENYTEIYIGEIKILNSKKKFLKNINLSDLFQYVENTIADNNWNRYNNPCEVFLGYQLKPKDKINNLRDDIIVGYTANFDLVNHYYSDDNSIKDLEKIGVMIGFLYYDNTDVKRENLVATRSRIEDEIFEMLDGKQVAEIIGGATGSKNSYIDLIIYDMDEFIGIIKDIKIELKELYYSNFYINSPIFLIKL